MGARYLIDTNAVIDYLAEVMPATGLAFMDVIFDSNDIVISVVTHIELLGFQVPEDYIQKCRSLIELAEVIPLVDADIVERVIQIRRDTKLKLPDAVIAATTLVHNLTLVSRNEKDFTWVKGLACTNPHNL
jgi:predicted nucleic acid-binding protein